MNLLKAGCSRPGCWPCSRPSVTGLGGGFFSRPRPRAAGPRYQSRQLGPTARSSAPGLPPGRPRSTVARCATASGLRARYVPARTGRLATCSAAAGLPGLQPWRTAFMACRPSLGAAFDPAAGHLHGHHVGIRRLARRAVRSWPRIRPVQGTGRIAVEHRSAWASPARPRCRCLQVRHPCTGCGCGFPASLPLARRPGQLRWSRGSRVHNRHSAALQVARRIQPQP